MSFASYSFLFFFIPLFFAIYYALPEKYSDAVMISGSVLFCLWGGALQLLISAALCAVTYFFGKAAAKNKAFMWPGILINAAVLCCFKYVPGASQSVPVGLSFIVFHAISYIADCAKRKKPCLRPVSFILYMVMFPKLVIGPIISFDDFESQWYRKRSRVGAENISDGVLIFTVGLAKKTALASSLSAACEGLWSDYSSSALSAWLAALLFGLQLYYDFSGYSDMARGLAKMTGYEFPVNFDYPYCSFSISSFFRRWHTSLGEWFKKYVYFPLGGSRKSLKSTLVNIIIVWLLTGIWHGNTVNYLVWGAVLGIIVCFEKLTGFEKNVPKLIGFLWQIFWVLLGWVLFNTENIAAAFDYYRSMFTGGVYISATLGNIVHDNWFLIAVSLFGCTPVIKNTAEQISDKLGERSEAVVRIILVSVLMLLSVLMLVNSGYSAFIYTRF